MFKILAWLDCPFFFDFLCWPLLAASPILSVNCAVETVVQLSSSDSTGLIRIAWYHWFVRSVIWDLQSFSSCCVNRLVKKGIKYFKSHFAKPPIWDWRNDTSISSSVSSDKCSESMAWPWKNGKFWCGFSNSVFWQLEFKNLS